MLPEMLRQGFSPRGGSWGLLVSHSHHSWPPAAREQNLGAGLGPLGSPFLRRKKADEETQRHGTGKMKC